MRTPRSERPREQAESAAVRDPVIVVDERDKPTFVLHANEETARENSRTILDPPDQIEAVDRRDDRRTTRVKREDEVPGVASSDKPRRGSQRTDTHSVRSDLSAGSSASQAPNLSASRGKTARSHGEERPAEQLDRDVSRQKLREELVSNWRPRLLASDDDTSRQPTKRLLSPGLPLQRQDTAASRPKTSASSVTSVPDTEDSRREEEAVRRTLYEQKLRRLVRYYWYKQEMFSAYQSPPSQCTYVIDHESENRVMCVNFLDYEELPLQLVDLETPVQTPVGPTPVASDA